MSCFTLSLGNKTATYRLWLPIDSKLTHYLKTKTNQNAFSRKGLEKFSRLKDKVLHLVIRYRSLKCHLSSIHRALANSFLLAVELKTGSLTGDKKEYLGRGGIPVVPEPHALTWLFDCPQSSNVESRILLHLISLTKLGWSPELNSTHVHYLSVKASHLIPSDMRVTFWEQGTTCNTKPMSPK